MENEFLISVEIWQIKESCEIFISFDECSNYSFTQKLKNKLK